METKPLPPPPIQNLGPDLCCSWKLLVQSKMSIYLLERREMLCPASKLARDENRGCLQDSDVWVICVIIVFVQCLFLPAWWLSYMKRGIILLVSTSSVPSTILAHSRCSNMCWMYTQVTPLKGSIQFLIPSWTEVWKTMFLCPFAQGVQGTLEGWWLGDSGCSSSRF